MLTWEELQQQAQFIINNKPTGEFEDISFTCRSGGSPKNKVGVPEVYRSDSFAYSTAVNGNAYRGEAVIRARKTGAFDKNGRQIYEAENGQLFVYRYRRGDPYSFDYGALIEPEL